MPNLNFNLYGFVEPKTKAEYMALLKEALVIADDLLEDIKRFGDGVSSAQAAAHHHD